jgi:hypothetical protein
LNVLFLMVRAQHVDHEKINIPVAIDVRKIDAHGKSARVPDGQVRSGAKVSATIVDPDAIRRKKVVAHINIRRAVAVDVTKHRRQAKIIRRQYKRPSLFIEKCSVCP